MLLRNPHELVPINLDKKQSEILKLHGNYLLTRRYKCKTINYKSINKYSCLFDQFPSTVTINIGFLIYRNLPFNWNVKIPSHYNSHSN